VWSKVFADCFRRDRNWISQTFKHSPGERPARLSRWFFVAYQFRRTSEASKSPAKSRHFWKTGPILAFHQAGWNRLGWLISEEKEETTSRRMTVSLCPFFDAARLETSRRFFYRRRSRS
jgi:hypothetical protein